MNVKHLPLVNGKGYALVDDDIYEEAKHFSWWADHGNYVVSELAKGLRLRLHHFVMGKMLKGVEWDHINRNPLDNRRENLRLTTRQQNSMNRGPNKNNSTGFKGVCFDKSRGKYLAGVKVNYRRVNLGRYKTAEEAARVYDAAARKHHGEYAVLNFP